jgi:PAS domain S-box-containing protein
LSIIIRLCLIDIFGMVIFLGHSLGTFSLRQSLILGVAFGIMLPALVFGYLLIQDRYQRELDMRVRTPMSQYADMLSQALAVPIWNVDRDVAKQFVQAVMRNNDVVRVTVEDESKLRFVHSEVAGRRDADTLREVRPIILDKKVIGTVTVELTTGRIRGDLIDDFLKLGGALLAQVIISFFLILLLFERRIVAPLQKLQLATEDLARGKLDQELNWPRQDEIGHLAQGLDKMRLDLGALIAERDLKNAALQHELNDRLRAEQALRFTEEKFAAIYHASPVAMSVFRKENTFVLVDVNDAWSRQFGWSRDQILASHDKQSYLWCKQADHDVVLDIIERFGEIHDYETWLRSGNGDKNLLCQISGRLIDLGSESLLVLIQEDITEKRQNEEEILTLNSSLERRVSERTHALEAANIELTAALENLQRAQKELLRAEKMASLGSLVAGIAHELNTPIGTSVTVASTLQQQTDLVILNLSKGLRRSELDDFLNKSRLGADILLRNLNKASELVTSFKQVAVDQTSANRRKFALDEMVAEIILTLSPTIRKTGHKVICSIPPQIIMDSYPGPLGQVLNNLIMNSFTHGFEGDFQGSVIISANILDVGNVEISVSDNGQGIPEKNIEKIFDPFFTTKLGQGGSGLGLNIVYNLVTGILGGQIVANSEVDKKTLFTITLPRVTSKKSQKM